MELKGKKILVVGLGKTGEALCEFLLTRQARIRVSDKKTTGDLGEQIKTWTQRGIQIETGGHRIESFLASDLIVLSPGVPYLEELEQAARRNIPILSEIELASKYLRGQIVGITGSNGKSTTASLTHQILAGGGLKSYLAGNIGTPLISFVDHSQDDHIYVTELSSFQLKFTHDFKPDISVFLNITQDHLDWHGGFEDYFRSKQKLIFSQNEKDIAILNRDDPMIWKISQDIRARVYGFSRMHTVNPGCYLKDSWFVFSDGREKKFISAPEIPLLGPHNQENTMSAALVGHILGINIQSIRSAVKHFKPLEHRLEKVITLDGIEFYNDSKATNVDAALKAIQSFDKSLILILGGRDKESDFTPLRESVKQHVKLLILIGEAKDKIKQSLQGTAPTVDVSSMAEAVSQAYSSARRGDVVLLAPACTSFDMFESFEHRGTSYKKEIFSLREKAKGKEI